MGEQTKIKNEKDETIKAGCAVVNKNNEILLISRKNENIWSFPKGHAEKGETLEETALRETKEETGYDVEIENRLSDLIYTNKKTGELIRVAMFKAKPLSQKDPTEKDGEFKWFSFEKARSSLYPNLVFLLDELK